MVNLNSLTSHPVFSTKHEQWGNNMSSGGNKTASVLEQMFTFSELLTVMLKLHFNMVGPGHGLTETYRIFFAKIHLFVRMEFN